MIDDSQADPNDNPNVNQNFILSNESEDNGKHRKKSDNKSTTVRLRTKGPHNWQLK